MSKDVGSVEALLVGLNAEQVRAVKTTEGPLLILAGAGSGKTKTLTHRIAYILATDKATPLNILAVTFTNKAAGEMRHRITELLGSSRGNRNLLPFMGTFHAICVRILRRDGEHIGVPRNFVIWDELDRLAAIKQVARKLNIDEKKFPPRLLAALISGAKNEMVTPAEYAAMAGSPTELTAAKVFPLYQDVLKENGALDFDDLIARAVELLSTHKLVHDRWQQQFKYVMIDEYQDTNAAQYQLVKLLTGPHHNIAVVGDDWQCLLPSSKVEISKGFKKIEDIARGEMVRSASGYGRSGYFKVTDRKKFSYKGEVIQIETASGKKITCTPNHLLFARWSKTDAYFVYLMHARAKGYRIGIAKGTRFDGKKDDIGLRVRANQERADRMWIIKVCESREEAIYIESLLAYKYGIPMLVFHAFNNRSMRLSQEYIDAIYREIDTEKRAQKLMAELGLAYEYPHFMPQATTRNGLKRVNVNVVLFGDKRVSLQSPWSASRISVNTTDHHDLQVFKNLGYTIRSGRTGTFRSEIHNLDFGKIERVLERIKEGNSEIQVCKYAFLTDKKFAFMPASQIHPGMMVPAAEDGLVIEDQVTDVKKETYSGPVYDLNVQGVHNYIASGIAVHNSIYSWRGADYRNILNFENDYEGCTVIKLEQNYRSSKNILDGAHNVISHNKDRSQKKLWTAADAGPPIQILQVSSERAEAEAIVRRIRSAVDTAARSFHDFAVLYRTNAQSRAIEEVFVSYSLPYRIVGGIRFYERKEIKDIMAYLRLIYQPDDSVSFERIVNVPSRGIGSKSLEVFDNWRRSEDISLSEALAKVETCRPLTARARQGLSELSGIITSFRVQIDSLTPEALTERLLRKLDYFRYLVDGTPQGEARVENVKELLNVAAQYHDTGLPGFLEEVALVSDLDTVNMKGSDNSSGFKNQDRPNAVTLMTLHSAKGLEFPVVFITGLEETVLPHSRALYDAGELEEERRLMYVGMTRAKQELYLIHAVGRGLYGGYISNPPSRFLADIQDSPVATAVGSLVFEDIDDVPSEPHYVLDLAEGEAVRHQIFGEGTVLEVAGETATIYFKGKGTKKLNIAFAPLQKI